MSQHRSDDNQAVRKTRSGSETRKRNRQVKLSLLPTEDHVLAQLATDAGHSNVQQYILAEFVEPRVRAAQAASAVAS
ncbi:hypothetical protein [Mycolicibacterium neoaurum]|uniref:hypothetical protein n=1 Tax=Mycolicibacterium neoaurum TaxID=1795 RepID=UPI001F4C6B22|nr:hypothetical protein [Mycolicibacterium neoaurum]